MDSYYDSPVKRSHSHSHYDDDDGEEEEEPEREDRDNRHKRRRASDDEQLHHREPQHHYHQQHASAIDIVYRILCPIPKIGAVIGKGGSIVKALRQETGAKIRVEDAVPGAEERVIYVNSAPGQDVEGDGDGRFDDGEEIMCPAQDALLKVYERITEGDGARSEEDDDEQPRQVTVRLLVPDSQIGCVIGKSGRIIEQMRRDIPAQIRVLPKASLPPCAFPTDELVQLSGTPLLVRRALYAVSRKLFENPPRDRVPGHSSHAAFPGGNFSYGGGPMMGPGQFGRSGPWQPQTGRSDGPLEVELTVFVLCPNDKIGKMIGKGGSVIRKLREDSGAKIKVCDQVDGSDERIIEVSAMECIDNFMSPVLEAAMQIQRRLTELAIEKDSRTVIAVMRMLIRANQIGCLLGKGGQIITEMRKATRANIRIPPKDELPRCADDNSELIQISGEPRAVEAALSQVLSRLRSNLFKIRDLGSGMVPMSGLPHQGSGPLSSSYAGRDGPTSPEGMYAYSGHDYGNYNTSPSRMGSGRSSKDSRRRQR